MAITGKKVLIGCAIGCGSMILIAVMAVVGFTLWLNSERELLQPQSLLGGDTQGYAEWTLDLEDPGTRGFIEATLEAIQSMPRGTGELPDWMESWMQQRQSRQAREDIMKLFPSVLAWTSTPGESPEGELHLVTVAIKPLGNRLVLGDWVMGWFAERAKDVHVARHGDERIYEFAMGEERSMAMFIRGVNLFFTSDVQTAKVAVDRLSQAEREGGTSEIDELFRSTEGGGPLRAAISNRNGQLARLWQSVALAPPSEAAVDLWAPLRSMTASGGLQADGSVAVELLFLTPDANWASTHGEALAEELRRGLSGIEFPLEIEQRAAGEELRIALSMPELVQTIRDWALRLQRGVERKDGSRIQLQF